MDDINFSIDEKSKSNELSTFSVLSCTCKYPMKKVLMVLVQMELSG